MKMSDAIATDKIANKILTLRIGKPLKQAIEDEAAAQGVSQNQAVANILHDALGFKIFDRNRPPQYLSDYGKRTLELDLLRSYTATHLRDAVRAGVEAAKEGNTEEYERVRAYLTAAAENVFVPAADE